MDGPPRRGRSSTGANDLAGYGTLIFNNNGALVSGGAATPVSFDFSQGAQPAQSIDLVFGSGSGGGTTTQYPIASTNELPDTGWLSPRCSPERDGKP